MILPGTTRLLINVKPNRLSQLDAESRRRKQEDNWMSVSLGAAFACAGRSAVPGAPFPSSAIARGRSRRDRSGLISIKLQLAASA
jgi:hypothetical protein